MKTKLAFTLIALLIDVTAQAQSGISLFRPDQVFDGEDMHPGWVVAIKGNRIVYAGEEGSEQQDGAERVLDLPGLTLLPGLIEGHSHIMLHPYNETSWNDQVLKESEAERVVRAVNHVRDTLLAGVTTMRDLGTEGAGYADIGVRDAINKGLIPGPRLLVAGRAIVATGSYGPKGFHERVNVPLGAQTGDGYDDLIRVVREQIGKGIDVVKVYADYRWGPDGTAAPTFTQQELETIVAVASSSGRQVTAHAATAEGMKRAIRAGIRTIEHGDGATRETYRLMHEHDVALCPTLSVGEAIARYNGWQKGREPDPPQIANKKASFRAALDARVTICFGGDIGPFPHGDNVRELELMVEYGMDADDALRSATSVNADAFGISDKVGRVSAGLFADLIAVPGNPTQDISLLRDPRLIVKDGRIVVQAEAATSNE